MDLKSLLRWSFFLDLSAVFLSVFGDGSLLNGQINITAEPGQNITLPCRAPDNKAIIVVEWSRTDLESEYVLRYRDEQFDPENQHLSFRNRVDLQDRQMKDGDVSLVLKNVTMDDRGTYECWVVQRGTNRRKRAALKTRPISSIVLDVVPSGHKDGSSEDGGNKVGPVGAAVGLSVGFIVAAAVVGFVIYEKRRRLRENEQAAAELELQSALQSPDPGAVS
ncbi:hypothetical protein ATANTOWER_019577 [Ataeniobius toweri]|uniref:Ig-like domain-containing protein n=1 Tax=Ataeniobius toweri TaxID=208326 RepID=A0ABU7AQ27_9TELE|nr:hypothetical protein [Ataeniobius toweri]